MGWNGIERNRMDYILTDLLPVELSELFSFTPFYSFLLGKEQQETIAQAVEKLKAIKAKGSCSIFQNSWSTKPLKYSILKGTDSMREMSVIQPLSALNLFLFMECYQKDILDFFNNTHCFSIRYHRKSKDLFYKSKSKQVTQYFQRQSSQLGKSVIQQTGNYFKISPFESINAFTDSRVWRMCNFKYKYYAKIDYKSCFDSIYTHAYSWIIERNVVDAKNAENPHLFMAIDRVLQNINGRSSNGILVGPEFSRMIAEVLLQQIDREVLLELSNEGILQGNDYSAFRYVDDIFIFANERKSLDMIIEKFRLIGERYLLRLNDLKLTKGETPCLPKEWLEKTRNISDIIANFFYQGKKADYDKLSEEKRFLVKRDFVSVDRIKDEIATLMKTYIYDKRTIVSFLLSTLLNNISKKKNGYTLFEKHNLGKALLLLDLALFIYAFYPSFDQTRKIISMISYMNDEIDFKNDENAHSKLCKTMQRYAFIFRTANLFDVCDWFPFFLEYKIFLDTKTETIIIAQATTHNDPIIWANLLLYSRYYPPFFEEMKGKIEAIIEKELSRISEKEPLLQTEIWYMLVFHNCPYISVSLRTSMDNLIGEISLTASQKLKKEHHISLVATKLVCDFLEVQSPSGNKPKESLFNWNGESNFSEQITYRTYQRTIFKRYHKNKYGLYASID